VARFRNKASFEEPNPLGRLAAFLQEADMEAPEPLLNSFLAAVGISYREIVIAGLFGPPVCNPPAEEPVSADALEAPLAPPVAETAVEEEAAAPPKPKRKKAPPQGAGFDHTPPFFEKSAVEQVVPA
jgi:hypothetical protein